MSVIIVVLALLALRYIQIGQTERRYIWVISYAAKALAFFKKRKIHNINLILLGMILPWLGFLVVVEGLIYFRVFGLVGFVVNLLFFWFALWPLTRQQLVAEGFETGQENEASQSPAYFLVEANQATFAVIFWFFLLGIYGALLYRFLNLLYRHAHQFAEVEGFVLFLNLLQKIVDWLPARLLGLTYALAGNFSPAFDEWKKYAKKEVGYNEILLQETGEKALAGTFSETALPEEKSREIIRLIDRSLTIWIVLAAFFTIAQTFLSNRFF